MAFIFTTYFIPASLDLEAKLASNPPTGIVKFSKDKLLTVLGNIGNRILTTREEEKYNGYVPMNGEVLRNKLSIKYYNQYLSWLEESGIIVSDHYYISGVKSIGFNFHSRFKDDEFVPVQVKRLVHKDSSSGNEGYELNAKRIYPFLWDSLSKVTVDYESVCSEIRSKYNAKPQFQNDPILQAAYFQDMLSISNVHHGISLFNIDSSGHRLHTPITNMRKYLRSFLRVNDQPLAEVDLSNSQLCFLIAVFDPEFFTSTSNFSMHNLYPEMHADLFGTEDQQKLLLALVQTVRKSDEYEDYCGRASSGTIYGHLAKELEKEFGGRVRTKSQIKKPMFRVLFAQNEYASDLKTVFAQKYPRISKLLEHLRSIDHRDFALLLQRIESYVVLRCTGDTVHSLFPEIPLLSIHDALLTPVEFLETVNSVLIDEVESHIRFAPRTKLNLDLTSLRNVPEPDQISARNSKKSRNKTRKFGDVRFLVPKGTVVIQPIPYPHLDIPLQSNHVVRVKYHYRFPIPECLCPSSIHPDLPCPICKTLQQVYGKRYLRADITGVQSYPKIFMPALTPIRKKDTVVYVPLSLYEYQWILSNCPSVDAFNPTYDSKITINFDNISQTQVEVSSYKTSNPDSDEVEFSILNKKLDFINSLPNLLQLQNSKELQNRMQLICNAIRSDRKKKHGNVGRRSRDKGSKLKLVKRKSSDAD